MGVVLIFEILGLPIDACKTLQKLYFKAKKLDPHLTEQRFTQAIITHWLNQYSIKYGNQNMTFKKDGVILRNNIKTAIRSSGKTQRQVASEIGINHVYLSEIIHGKYEPGITVALLLYRALYHSPAQIEKLFYLQPVP